MTLHDDMNEAISPVFFGMTIPFWDRAVTLQLRRLEPREAQAVEVIAAFEKQSRGTATGRDLELCAEVTRLREFDFTGADHMFLLTHDLQVSIDSTFLVLAMRESLRMADEVVKRLKSCQCGKCAAGAKRLRDHFSSRFGAVKDLADIVRHHDDYIGGQGKLSGAPGVDKHEGLGLDQDPSGRLVFKWGGKGGREVKLLEAARASLELSKGLQDFFWGAVTAPSGPATLKCS